MKCTMCGMVVEGFDEKPEDKYKEGVCTLCVKKIHKPKPEEK